MRDNKVQGDFFPGRRSFGLWMALIGALLGLGFAAPAAQAAIAYVQSKSTSQNNSAQTTVTTVFSSAQVAGDLNVVAVGWGNATGISSVTDTKGNTYTVAVGPTTVSGLGSAVIYYAKNIVAAAAGANTVTVTFSAAVPYPDVRIAEYSGINTTAPLDVTAVANGTGTLGDSGSATTSNANDLLIGSDWVGTGTPGPGAGYTSRQISGYDGDILEDQIVTTVGAYNATAPVSPSAGWIMQMAAFKAASSGADTTAPNPPTTVQATTVSSSQINVSWSGATDNVAVTGYLIERCLGATCTTLTPSGAVSSYSDTGLAPSSTYIYRVRATDAAGNISGYSTVTATATTQAAPAIAYVQSKSTSQNNSAQTTVTTVFSSAQVAGDLNVVAVGWGSATIGIKSITDTKGNAYVLAVGPTAVSALGTAVIYYAKNIVAAAAGANTVTVTFNAAVPYPDVRIAEYSGINTTAPLDVTAVANGTGALGDSGPATTSNANDLLIGSNWVGSGTPGPGAGYTSRQISGYDGDILEDQIVTAVGSYNATAPVSPSAGWIMQMAAFKSAASGGSGGGDTTPPGVPTAVSATVVSSTQINLSWTAPTDNVGVTGYSIQRCQGSNCTTLSPSGTATSYSDTGLSASTTYSYQIRATDAAGNWGGYSTPAASATTNAGGTPDTTAPSSPVLMSAVAVSSTQINLAWGASTDNVGVTGYQLESCTGAGCSSFASLGTPVTTTAYSATALTAGAIYSFRLRASDAAGNLSSYSNVLSATTPTAAGSSSTVAYDYDALGRLVQAEMPVLGTVQAYNYDPAGNITSSVVAPITALTFGGLSAQQGAVGGQITIYGSGFSTSAGSNTVTIGGAAATVVSATATRLVVAVPAGAITGSISVTTGGSTVTSSRPFVIVAGGGIPALTSFSPNIVAAGDTVTLSGSNFDPVLARNRVLLNGVVLPLISGTTSTLTVKIPSAGTSGHLQVVTPRGSSALTTAYLIIPPPSFTVGNVGPTGLVTANGAATTLTFANNSQVLLGFFDAQQGDQFIRVLCSLSTGAAATARIFAPDGTDMGALYCGGFKDLPRLNRSGTYTIAASAPSPATSSFTFSVTKAIVKPLNAGWYANGNVTSVNNVRGLAHRFTVSGVKGETLGLLFSPSDPPRSDAPGYPVIKLVSPQGAAVWQTSVTSGAATLVITGALPTTDTYTVVVDPGPSATPAYVFAAGSAVNMALDDPAAMLYTDGSTKARVFFQATAGQAFSLHVTHDPLYPSSDANIYPYLHQFNLTGCCDQSLWAQVSSQRMDFSVQVRPLLATSLYYIEFNPSGLGGAFDVRVLSAPTVTLTSSTALTIPTVGQAGRFTFSGTAGMQTAIALAPSPTQSLNGVQYQLAAPDGTSLISWQFRYLQTGPRPVISLTLPQSGQYSVWIVPVTGDFGGSISGNPPTTTSIDASQIAPGSVIATLSNPMTGTIPFNGSAVPVQPTLPGQGARLTVTGAASHTGSLKVINSGSCDASIRFENAAQPTSYTSYSANGSTTNTFSLPVTTISSPYLLEVAPVTGCTLNLSLQLTGN